jgi:hypothetical protein
MRIVPFCYLPAALRIEGRTSIVTSLNKRFRGRLRIPTIIRSLLWTILAGLLIPPEGLALFGPGEYQVKGAFLYNFMKFVDWPEKSFDSPNEPIVLGVIGPNSLVSALEEVIRGKTVKGHPLIVHGLKSREWEKKCHVLYFLKSDPAQTRDWIARVQGKPVLTVGEMENFAALGGAINFYLSENQVRFEINPEVAEMSGLKISSQLLALARIVSSTPAK